jgi:hypothetical protein
VAASGLFGTDCQDSSWAWLDLGCDLQSAGSVVGQTVSNALLPVYILLGIAFVFLLVLAFAPNIRHIFPKIVLA